MLVPKILPVALVSIGVLFTGCQSNKSRETISDNFLPQEHVEEHEESEEQKQARIAWIEEMHKAPDHVDWRKKDKRLRQRKQLKYFKDKSKVKLVDYIKSNNKLVSQGDAQENLPASNPNLLMDAPLAQEAIDVGIDGNWIEKGSNNIAGRIRALTYSPINDSIYAGSDGGQLWRGSLDGNDWVNLNDQVRFTRFKTIHVFEHNGGKRILVTDSKEIFYSDDEGQTWDIATGISTTRDHEIGAMLNDGSHFVVSYNNGGTAIYRSTNFGESYTNVWVSLNRVDQVNIFADENEINGSLSMIDRNNFYVWNGNSFIFTGSLDFSVDSNLQSNFERMYLARSGANVYVLVKAGGTSYVFRSTDNGSNWVYRGSMNATPYSKSSFAVGKDNPDIVTMGGVDFWRSTNGGQSWVKQFGWSEYYGNIEEKLHADIQDIKSYYVDGEEIFLIATDGGIYDSHDDLNTVLNLSMEKLNVAQFYSAYTHHENPNIIFAGSQDQGFQRTFENDTGLVNFEQLISGDYGELVSQDGGKSLWFVYPGTLRYFEQADNPNSISSVSISKNTLGFDSHVWIQPTSEHPTLENSVLMAGGLSNGGCFLYRVTRENNSFNWEQLPMDFSDGNNSTHVTAIGYSPVNTSNWYVLTSKGNFYYSTNAGQSWDKTDIDGVGNDDFYGADVFADPVDPDKVYISGSGYSGVSPVYVSSNNGQSFTPLNNGIPETLVYKLTLSDDGEYLFAATEVGAYVMPTSGTEWFDLGGPEQIYTSVEYVPSLKTARFATYGRGIWDFNMSSFPASSEYYHIVHKGTKLRFQTCNTDEGSWVDTRDSTSTWHCTQWRLVPNGDYFYIQNRNSGMYIRPVTANNGAALEQRPTSWNGNWTQWSYTDTGDGYGHLVNKATGKFVFVTNEGVIQQQPNTWTGDWTRYEFVPVVE